MRKNFQQRGFTLIELLVVIVILGILSTISVGTFRSYFAKARDSERVSTVQNVAMMIKVDSGGSGDCTVYNYAKGGADCATENLSPGLSNLLSENDYSMPGEKNGLAYFYGVNIGATEGDNNFFIIVGAEEDVPQNGKQIGTTAANPYVFVDGTTKGINSALGETDVAPVVTPGSEALGICTWDVATHQPDCTAATDWLVYPINNDGTLGAAL
jgi:prepilin-type N-terminal cleavage/methylation domain-containing protein